MSHYLFFSSEGKASFDFTTELNQPLALDGQWEGSRFNGNHRISLLLWCLLFPIRSVRT